MYKKLARITIRLLEANYTAEAKELLAALPRERPVNKSIPVTELFSSHLKRHRTEHRNFIEVKPSFRKDRMWEPFHSVIKGADEKTLTYWVDDIRSLANKLNRSQFWEYMPSIPGGVGRHYFISKPIGHRELVFVLAINVSYNRFTLSIRPLDTIIEPEVDEEEEDAVTFDEFVQGDEELEVDEFKKLAKDSGVRYEKLTFADKSVVFFFEFEGTKYIADLESDDTVQCHEASSWLDSSIDSAENLVNVDDLEDFWSTPSPLYHATPSENKEDILELGIYAEDKTRGMTNRWVGSSVFTSFNPEAIDSYGDTIFEIDTAAMKRDGYTPRVSMEPGIVDYEAARALVDRFDMEEDYILDPPDDGVDAETVIVNGNIPAKYLSLLD